MSPGVPEDVSPYRGLAAFGDTDLDARLFFGRDRESEIVAANLQAFRLTVLYGATGVGKSSLLRAGVVHRLRANGDTGAARQAVVVCASWRGDPVGSVTAAVADAVAATLGEDVTPTPGRSFVDELDSWCTRLDGEIYIVLDQLEEYVLYHGADRGGPLADALATIVTRPSLRVGILIGIRDDALSELDTLKAKVPGLFANLLRLDHLTREEGRAAIVGPLEELARLGAVGVTAEEALVESVLDQVAAGKIVLGEGASVTPETSRNGRIEAPFLQLVMERVWAVERGRGSTTLRAATLEELGGAARIVEEHLERALASLDDEGRAVAASMFGFLVTPSGTKIAHRADDLARYAAVDVARAQPVLDGLADERILRRGADAAGAEPRYEIFHDVLAPAVLAWRDEYESERTIARERRRRRRAMAVAAVAAAAVCFMAGVTVFALAKRNDARDRAREAQAHALEARATTLLPTDPELAMLLAAESTRIAPSPSAEDVLRSALLLNRLMQVLPADGPVVDVAFEFLNELWTASSDGSARYYTSAPFELALRARHSGPVTAVAPDVEGMLSASLDHTARLTLGWQADPAARPLVLRHPKPVVAVTGDAFCGAADPVCIVTGAGHTIWIWDHLTGHRIARVDLPTDVREIVTLPSGRVAVRAADSIVRVIDAKRHAVVQRFAVGERVESIAAHPDREIVAAGLADGSVRLWNAANGRPVARFPTHTGSVLDLDLEGDLLLTGSADGTATVRNIATGHVVPLPGGHGNLVRAVELSSDGRFAVTASSDRTAKVWETSGGRLVALLAGHTDSVVDAAFSDGAGRVVTASLDGTARVWSSGTQAELRQTATGRPPPPPSTNATASDGAHAVAVDNEVQLTTATGQIVTLRGHRDTVNSVAFSVDGSRVVTASRDHDARIWDARSGALLHQLKGHFGSVVDARFSPDGRWVVTAGPITAGLWSVRTGQLFMYLRGPKSRLTAAAFDGDSRTIRTTETRGTSRRYRCDLCGASPVLVALARERLRATGRTLTQEERALYFG